MYFINIVCTQVHIIYYKHYLPKLCSKTCLLLWWECKLGYVGIVDFYIKKMYLWTGGLTFL